MYNFKNTMLIPRNVVLTFNNTITNTLIDWSTQLNEVYPSKIILNRIDAVPHMTLYTTQYPEENEQKVMDTIGSFVQNRQPIEVAFTKTSFVVGTVFLDAIITPQLTQLHSDLVDLLNPLRNGAYDKEELKLPGLTAKMKQCLIDYGMWAVKDIYVPHISLGRPFNGEDGPKMISLLPNDIHITTQVSSLSFVETGPNGTCKKIIKTFPFKGG